MKALKNRTEINVSERKNTKTENGKIKRKIDKKIIFMVLKCIVLAVFHPRINIDHS